MAGGFWRFYEMFNRGVCTFTGPAQIGAGHDEKPEVRSTDPACPICHARMSAHVVERTADQRTSTRLICPRS